VIRPADNVFKKIQKNENGRNRRCFTWFEVTRKDWAGLKILMTKIDISFQKLIRHKNNKLEIGFPFRVRSWMENKGNGQGRNQKGRPSRDGLF